VPGGNGEWEGEGSAAAAEDGDVLFWTSSVCKWGCIVVARVPGRGYDTFGVCCGRLERLRRSGVNLEVGARFRLIGKSQIART
jgi:hypothetical protein